MQPHWILWTHTRTYKFFAAIFYDNQVDEFGILTNFSDVYK